MTGQELLDKAKKIFVKVPKSGVYWPIDSDMYKPIFDKYGDEITVIGDNDAKENDHFHDIRNTHHYNPKYIYNNWISVFNHVLEIDIDEDDFFIVKNIIDGEDYSYFQAKKEKIFNCKYCSYDGKCAWVFSKNLKCNYASLCNTTIVMNEDVLASYNIHTNTPYHRLFAFSHQVSIIENEGSNNGKTLFISCDSHMVPIIPLLCYYYKKVIIYDNRTIFNFDFGFLPEEADDLLIVFSENFIPKKYINLYITTKKEES